MKLEQYLDKEVEVTLNVPTSFSQSKNGENLQGESNLDNVVKGKVIEAQDDSFLKVEEEKRGRFHRYDIPQAAIGFIYTSELTEAGKERSERMKAMHTKTDVVAE
jgi:hypothetical protein